MRRPILFASACAVVCAVPALADDVATRTTTPQPVKVRKICREDTATGSVMMHSTCHTREEWAQIDRTNNSRAEQFSERLQRTVGGGPAGTPQ
jgi:hypothetical protein